MFAIAGAFDNNTAVDLPDYRTDSSLTTSIYTEFYEFNEKMYAQMESSDNEDRYQAYFWHDSVSLNYPNIKELYSKETTLKNKRILALMGYRMYPHSKLWKARFLKYFPQTEKDIEEVFHDEDMYGDGARLSGYVSFLRWKCFEDRDMFNLYVKVYGNIGDGVLSECMEYDLFSMATERPYWFFKSLERLPESPDILLWNMGCEFDTLKAFNCPFTRELKRLTKSPNKHDALKARKYLSTLKESMKKNYPENFK